MLTRTVSPPAQRFHEKLKKLSNDSERIAQIERMRKAHPRFVRYVEIKKNMRGEDNGYRF